MKKSQSLRRRIVGAFAIFAVVLIVVMVGSFHSVSHFAEDIVLQGQLEAELDDLLSQPELLDSPKIELGRFITAYIGLEAVEPEFRAQLEPLQPGVYEFGDITDVYDWFANLEIHVRVQSLPDRPERLYLVFEATSLNITRLMGPVYLIAIAVSLLLVGLVGASTGRILSGLVIRPVTALAEELREGPLETLANRIEPKSYGEEVGELAQALAVAAERLRSFVKREREFTANASHELRTPITVIRGAAELLKTKIGGDDPSLAKPLERIFRAVAAMEETIEVFLALAREGEIDAPEEENVVADVVAEVVEQHRRSLGEKPVGVVVQVPEDVRVKASPRVLEIVLGNLVGNAFRRTSRGTVTISWKDSRIEVVDTGPGIPEEIATSAGERHVGSETGHGLGLSIVTALCERFGWQLHLESAEGSGARATLDFDASPHPDPSLRSG